MTATIIPVIETERAVIRPYRLSDFDAHVTLWADPQVTRYIGGRPFTREESWDRYLRVAGLWPVLGFGFWAVEERASGRLVGNAGFHDLKRRIEPSIEGLPEAGWALLPEMHGKGFATEVVAAIHRWSDATLPHDRTVAIVDPGNTASLRVAKKCGYRELLTTLYRGAPTVLLERRAPPR